MRNQAPAQDYQVDGRDGIGGARFSFSGAFLLILALKAFYLAAIILALYFFPDGFEGSDFYHVKTRWPAQGEPVFLSHFATWDAAHYLRLSQSGYERDIPSCAFYPLWPFAMRWAAHAVNGHLVIVGVILANVFSGIAFVLFYKLVHGRFGAQAAGYSLAFLLAFPGALFFQFAYSESLFFLLLMVFVTALERRRYWAVAISGMLLPLTRALGVFCLLPLAWHFIKEWLGPKPAESNWSERLAKVGMKVRGDLTELLRCGPGKNGRSLVRACLLLAAPLAGYALYFALMKRFTGNALEGFEAQRHWNYAHSISNLFDPVKFLVEFLNPQDWHKFRGSVLDRLVFWLFACCLPIVWKLDKGWFIWALVLGLVPAMSGTYVSFTRFASIVFPFYIALGLFCAPARRCLVRCAILTVFIILHLVLVWRFVNFRWAG